MQKCPQSKGHGWPRAVAPGQLAQRESLEGGREGGGARKIPGPPSPRQEESKGIYQETQGRNSGTEPGPPRRGLCSATKRSAAARFPTQEDRLPFPGGGRSRGGRGEETLVCLVILPPAPRAPNPHSGRGQRRKRTGTANLKGPYERDTGN